MPDPAVANTARLISTIQQDNGDINQNVMHFHYSGAAALNNAELQALAVFWEATWSADLKPKITGNDRLVNVRTQDLSSVPYLTWDQPFSVLGTAAGVEMPKQSCAVLSIKTAHPGRSGRGRFFCGSLDVSSLTGDGKVAAGTIAALQTFGNDLITGTVSGPVTMVLGLYSRKLGTTFPATSVICDSRWDVQRRRANRRIF